MNTEMRHFLNDENIPTAFRRTAQDHGLELWQKDGPGKDEGKKHEQFTT